MQAVYAYDPYNMGSNVPMPYSVGYSGQPIPVPAQPMAGQVTFGGIQCVMVADPMLELDSCQSVIIRQQPELFEAITGCETQNRYHVLGNCNGVYKYLFKCRERSSYCMRACCPSNIREFNMEIFHAVSGPLTGNISGKFANAFKPWKFPCFCCNRPEIMVNLGAQNKYVGKIKHMFTCCDPEFEVYNSNGLKYFVRADCCQCGLLCANSIIGKMGEAYFNIIDPESKEQIGTINKKSPVASNNDFNENENYKVTFPEKASINEKLLLLSLGLMIDYEYFELDPSVI